MDDKIEYVDINYTENNNKTSTNETPQYQPHKFGRSGFYKEPPYDDVTLDEAIELLKDCKDHGVNGNLIIGEKYDRTNECNHTEKTPPGYKYKEVFEYKITIITKEYTLDGEE